MRRVFLVCPVSGPDPRQRSFIKSMAAMAAELQQDPTVTSLEGIALDGFPASYPNLGWLQTQVRKYQLAHHPPLGELCALIEQELPQVVQRVKEVRAAEGHSPDVLKVAFDTKDDWGNYGFHFLVPLAEG